MSLQKSSKFIRFFSSGENKGVGMPTYRFKSFVLNVSERQLCRADEPVPLTPKVFDTLVYLVERAGRLAEKENVMAAVWPDTIVEEGNLARSIHTLRKILGQSNGDDVYIETVPTKGYRFVAPVELVDSTASSDLAEESSAEGMLPALKRRRLASLIENLRQRPVLFLGSISTMAIVTVLVLTSFGSYISEGSLLPSTTSGLAYREFKQGKLILDNRHSIPNAPRTALEHFQRALAADPNYLDAIAGEADARMYIFWETKTHDDIIKARAAIDRAISMDGSNSYSRTINCRLLATYDGKLEQAEAECRRAIQLDPGNAEAHRELAFLLNSVGRSDEALESMQVAASLAATSFNKRSVGVLLYYAGRYDEAIDQLGQVGATDPDFAEAYKWISWAYERKGDEWNAFNALAEEMRRGGADPQKIDQARATFDQGGWKAVLRARLAAKQGKNPSMIDAGDYAQLGETEEAFRVLEELYRRRAVMIVTIGREPRLDPIRNDSRFADLLKRVGVR